MAGPNSCSAEGPSSRCIGRGKRVICPGMAPSKRATFQPVQLEFRFETRGASSQDQGRDETELARQVLALNERLLAAYLEDLRGESPARRRKAARGLANLGDVGRRAI